MANKNVNILLKLEDQFTSKMVKAGKITKEQSRAMSKCSSQVLGFSRNVRKSFTSAIGHVAKFGAALAGIGGVLSIAGLKSFASEAQELAKAQIEAETKLEAALKNVDAIASKGAPAIRQAKEELMGVASELQKVGVIGDEVTLAGMQQLATYQMGTSEISALSKGMDDLLAKQYGLNATQENAVAVAKMLGKAYQGRTGSLEKAGVLLSEQEKQILKNGTAEQKTLVLSQALERSVGGVNAALADTDQGKLQQFANQWGDMKEEVGKHILSLKATLAANFVQYIPRIQEIAISAVEQISAAVLKAVDWLKAHADQIKQVFAGIKDGVTSAWNMIKPALTWMLQNARTLIPVVLKAGAAIAGISVVADVANKIHGFVGAVKTAGTALKGLFTLISGHPIILVIAGIVAAITYLWTHSEKFRNFVKQAAAVIVAAWNRIKDTAVRVKDGAIAAFNVLKSTVSTIFNAIKTAIAKVMDWIEQKIDAVKRAVQAIKQTWRDLTSGSWYGANETGYVSRSAIGEKATGTPYFAGGLTSINEGGRGEIVTLPSGTQIIPHDVSEKAVGGNSYVFNFTIQGNVIGNRQYMEETCRYMTQRVKAALATV